MVLVLQIAFAMGQIDAILGWKMRLSTISSNWLWAAQPEGLEASGMLAVRRWYAATSFYDLQNPTFLCDLPSVY